LARIFEVNLVWYRRNSRIRLWRISALLCLPIVWNFEVAAAQTSDRARALEDFVIGNAQFVLLHELAHLVINEKKVPILGPEESAADYIASMLLVRPVVTPQAGSESLLRFALSTADGFVIAWQRAQVTDATIPYWGSHALNVQRFSTVACLLYGSNPARFSSLPELVRMPPARIRSCPREYEKAAYSIDWLFATYGRGADDPPGSPIEIRYEQPPSLTSLRLLHAIQKHGFIERTFARFEEFFALDEPVTFEMRACGDPQAAWLPDERTLVFCYELLDTYALMSMDQHTDAIESMLQGPTAD
jgi:hypothetical protein